MSQLQIDSTLLDATIYATHLGLEMAGIKPPPVGASRMLQFSRPYAIIVGLVGRNNGTVALNMGEKALLYLAGKLLGEEVSTCDEDAFDAVMEIGNIVAGGLKERLQNSDYGINAISLPSLVIGANYHVYYSRNMENVSVDFELAELPFSSSDHFFSTTVSLLRSPGS